MRLLWAGGLLAALLCTSDTRAGDTQAPRCDAMVGVWEYVPPSAPGYAIIARQGGQYLGTFINTLSEPYGTQRRGDAARTPEGRPDLYSVAGTWEYACEALPGVLRLRMRWLFSSYRPQDTGSEFTIEAEPAEGQARWWVIGPDGKRSAMGAGRKIS